MKLDGRAPRLGFMGKLISIATEWDVCRSNPTSINSSVAKICVFIKFSKVVVKVHLRDSICC